MNDATKLAIAKAICVSAHKGQVDKAGVDYCLHPLHVSEKVNGTDEKVCAMLHDVLEDTPFPRETLLDIFGDKIVHSLDCLNHADGEAYEDYIKRVATDGVAIKVKLADIDHNSDLSRIEHPTEKDIKRLDRYRKAKDYLLAFV